MNSVKKIAILAAALALVFCSQSVSAFAGQIEDMPAGWAEKAVQSAVERGLLTPYGGRVYPERAVTRAEMAAMINRLFGSEAKASLTSFHDVPSSSWYADDMAKAVQMQAFQGTDGKLMPEKSITRQEAFVVLSRILELSDEKTMLLNEFQDGNHVASWAKSGTAAMVSSGYVKGFEGLLRPDHLITRAEFAQMMYQIAGSSIHQSGEYSQAYRGNLFISATDVTLKDTVIAGDLVLCDGIGSGHITLDHVKVKGRIVVRGGGKNTVELIASEVAGEIIMNNRNNAVRLRAAEGTVLNTVVVQNQAILEASIDLLKLSRTAEVTLQGGKIGSLLSMQEAEGSKITVESGASIFTATIQSSNTALLGKGQITHVQANADGISVNTGGTKITVAQGMKEVKAGGVNVEGGKEAVVDRSGTGAVISGAAAAGSKGSAGGGSGSSGGGAKPDPGTKPTDKNWIDLTKTGIVAVDFVSYATIALRIDQMNSEALTEYDYYIEGVKQESSNISKVMKSTDGSLLVIKMMLPNNTKPQQLKLVKGSEYMAVQLNEIGNSIKE